MSLKKGLEKLGYKTYHMEEIIERENHHARMWLEIAETHKAGKPLAGRFRKLFENYTAVVDFPAAAWWKEILEDFPKAKVILSERKAESWYVSCSETIFAFTKSWQIKAIQLFSPFFNVHAEMVQAAIWDKVLGPGMDPALPELREKTIDAYNEHVQLARSMKGISLLAWKVGDGGWAPLCKFLDVSADKCPSNEAFPHANDRQAFFTTFLLPMSIALILLFLSPVWVPALVWICCCRRPGTKARHEKSA